MKCPNCQTELLDGAQFCGVCDKPPQSEQSCTCSKVNPQHYKFCTPRITNRFSRSILSILSATVATNEIIQRRKEVKSRTLEVRRDYNRTAREQGHGP